MEEINKSVRNRSSNFTSNEESFLFNCIAKYKDVIENKKTDGVTNQEKSKMWEKITREFTCISPGNNKRPTEVLKRFYENKKRIEKKKTANKKIRIKGTGGGPPDNIKDDPTDDLLLSIMNEQTVHDLECSWGGDIDSDESENESHIPVVHAKNNVEIVYENVDTPNSPLFLDSNSNIPEIVNDESSQNNVTMQNPTWQTYKPSDLLKPVGTPLKRKISSVLTNTNNVESNKPGPSNIKETPQKSARRRPAVTVKALTSSDIALKYNKLLDGRLEIVAYTKTKLEQELSQSASQHNKAMTLLEVQIEIEKVKLKKLKSSSE